MRGCPALLGRGGRFRQAIPGLSETASASLPRPRLRAADPPRPVMLGAARRGERQKRKRKSSEEDAARDEMSQSSLMLATKADYHRGRLHLKAPDY